MFLEEKGLLGAGAFTMGLGPEAVSHPTDEDEYPRVTCVELRVTGLTAAAGKVLPSDDRCASQGSDDKHLPPELRLSNVLQVEGVKYEEGDNICSDGKHFGHHEWPRDLVHLKPHSDQLGQDEGCEGDGHDAYERGLEQVHGHQHDGSPLVNGLEDPLKECAEVETPRLVQLLVEFRELQHVLLTDILVEHDGEHREHGVHRRVPHQQPPRVNGDRHEVEDSGENGLDDRDDQPTVDHELAQPGRSLVRVPPVPCDEPQAVAELFEGEVCRQAGVPPFLPLDPKPDVGCKDHTDVVPTVPDGRRAQVAPLRKVVLDHLHHVGLLGGTAACHHDGGGLASLLYELQHGRWLQHSLKGMPVDHHGHPKPLVTELHVLLEGREVVEGILLGVDWLPRAPLPPLPHVLVRVRHAVEGEDVSVPGNQLGAPGDAGGRLNLVPRQHPDLHAGIAEVLEGLGHVILQLILNTTQPHQLKILFESGANPLHCFCWVTRQLRGLELCGEGVVLLLAQLFAPEDQGPEPVLRQVGALFRQPRRVPHYFAHHRVGTLHEQVDHLLTGCGVEVLYNDPHALALGREGELLQNGVVQAVFHSECDAAPECRWVGEGAAVLLSIDRSHSPRSHFMQNSRRIAEGRDTSHLWHPHLLVVRQEPLQTRGGYHELLLPHKEGHAVPVAVLKRHAHSLGKPHQGNLVRAGGLVLVLSITLHRCDVVGNSYGSDSSNEVLPLTLGSGTHEIAPPCILAFTKSTGLTPRTRCLTPRRLLPLSLSKPLSYMAVHVIRVAAEPPTSSILPCVKLFEHHVVLGQCARLIRKEIPDPTKLLGKVAVAHHHAFYLLVLHDEEGVHRFPHVEVDAERDGDDRRKQQDEAEEGDVPLAREPLQPNQEEGEEEGEDEEKLRKVVQLQVDQPNLRRWLVGIK
eukprot:Sspe_Gene.44556::Locus_21865_Transcript_1_1_Confidence_1.000_Length_3924::g.44556::m.44556